MLKSHFYEFWTSENKTRLSTRKNVIFCQYWNIDERQFYQKVLAILMFCDSHIHLPEML